MVGKRADHHPLMSVRKCGSMGGRAAEFLTDKEISNRLRKWGSVTGWTVDISKRQKISNRLFFCLLELLLSVRKWGSMGGRAAEFSNKQENL